MDHYFFDTHGIAAPVVDTDGLPLGDDREARDVAMFLLCEYYMEGLFDTGQGQIVTIRIRREDGSVAAELLLSIAGPSLQRPDARTDASATNSVVPLRPARLGQPREGDA